MRDGLVWFLLFLVVVTALFVVNARHQHRVAYLAYQDEESRRDDLSDEWGRLLIAEQLWSSPNVIEADAREKLGMRSPKKGEMQVVRLGEKVMGGEYAAR